MDCGVLRWVGQRKCGRWSNRRRQLRAQLVWDVVRKRQGRRIIRNMLKDAVVSKSSRMAGIPFRYDAPTDGGTIKPLP
eukprot:3688763-Rhodomonas_salina.2